MKFLKAQRYTTLSYILKYAFIFMLFVSISMPFFANAGHTVLHVSNDPILHVSNDPNANSNNSNTNSSGGSSSSTINAKIDNPLSSGINDIPTFILALLKIALTIGVPVVALAIIYSGFLFVQAQGNAEKLKKAKAALMYTIIGAAILLGCLIIANAIQATVNEIKS